MSEAEIEVLKPVYAEWSHGNFRPVTDAYGDDLEWGWSEEFPDIAGMSKGAEGQESLLRWLSSWDHWQVEAEEYLSAGDTVLVMCRYTGRGKGSGVSVDTEGAHLWTVRDGRATRLVIYSDRDRAREAAGLGGG
jgi:ketosteroid isomerase-like protein